MKKHLIYILAMVALASIIFGAINCGGDDDKQNGNDDDAKQDDDDNDDSSNDNRSRSELEKACRAQMNNTIKEGERFKPGIYHVYTNVYATNMIVNETLKGPMPMNLWVRIATNKEDDASAHCITAEDWGESGENCCAVGNPECQFNALLCFVNIPDEGANDIDGPVTIGKDGKVRATMTNVVVPKDFNESLTEDSIGTITMDLTITSPTCLKTTVDIKLTSVQMGSINFNSVTLRNYDIESWPDRGYDYPKEDIAVGWWERFYLGLDAEIEKPYPWEEADKDPSTIKTEPVCLDPRQVKKRDY